MAFIYKIICLNGQGSFQDVSIPLIKDKLKIDTHTHTPYFWKDKFDLRLLIQQFTILLLRFLRLHTTEILAYSHMHKMFTTATYNSKIKVT